MNRKRKRKRAVIKVWRLSKMNRVDLLPLNVLFAVVLVLGGQTKCDPHRIHPPVPTPSPTATPTPEEEQITLWLVSATSDKVTVQWSEYQEGQVLEYTVYNGGVIDWTRLLSPEGGSLNFFSETDHYYFIPPQIGVSYAVRVRNAFNKTSSNIILVQVPAR
jgi:hypothetical protein